MRRRSIVSFPTSHI